MDSIATAVTIPRLFGGIYITRPVIGSEQCQSETNVSIVEYVWIDVFLLQYEKYRISILIVKQM
jgi:hypothetical protein